jgi:hypothetical protein
MRGDADSTMEQQMNRPEHATELVLTTALQHAVAMGNEIILLRKWIEKHGKHGTDCYSKRNSERDCDCGLYEIRQSFKADTATEQK